MKSVGIERRLWPAVVAACLLVAVSACSYERVRMPDAGEMEPDKYLFDHGKAASERHHWLESREYFRKLVETYTQSSYRQEARLGIGDTYLGEGGYANYILAANEFREFLRFYPLNPRADYAQYRLAVAEFRQMLKPERDQSATRQALTEIKTFVRLYPDSKHLTDVLTMERSARDRLSDSEFDVGFHYFRGRWYFGAIPRFQGILTDNPSYARRDAVYYFLAESFYRTARPAEALPFLDRLLQEFTTSEYLDRAKERSAAIKRSLDSAPVSPPAASAPPTDSPSAAASPQATH